MKILSSEEIIALCVGCEVFRQGHFQLASGKHGDIHVDLERALDDPSAGPALGQTVALRWLDHADAPRPQALIGPANGGAKLAVLAAQAFNSLSPGQPPVIPVSVNKDGTGGFCLTASDHVVLRDMSVLAVEDVSTTGGSLAKAIVEVRKAGANVFGGVVILNRGDAREIRVDGVRDDRQHTLVFPLLSLATLRLPTYSAEDCPLCADEIPIGTDLGPMSVLPNAYPARSS